MLVHVVVPVLKLAILWCGVCPVITWAVTGNLPFGEELIPVPMTPRRPPEEIVTPELCCFIFCAAASSLLMVHEISSWADYVLRGRSRRHDMQGVGVQTRISNRTADAEEVQEQGVRLRICMSAHERPGQANSIVAFAVIEPQRHNQLALVLRQRGGRIIAHLTLPDLEVVDVGRRMVLIAPVLPTGVVSSAAMDNTTVIAFEDNMRLDLFFNMMARGGIVPVTLRGAAAERLAQQRAEYDRREREREPERVVSSRGGSAANDSCENQAPPDSDSTVQEGRPDGRKVSKTESVRSPSVSAPHQGSSQGPATARSPANSLTNSGQSMRAARTRPQPSPSPGTSENGRSRSVPVQREHATELRGDGSPWQQRRSNSLRAVENPLTRGPMYGPLDWLRRPIQDSSSGSWRAMHERHAELERGRQLRELMR